MKKDWEINPNLYLTDSKGDFILKKDGTPKKKSGRPKGSKNSYPRERRTKRQIIKVKRTKTRTKVTKK